MDISLGGPEPSEHVVGSDRQDTRSLQSQTQTTLDHLNPPVSTVDLLTTREPLHNRNLFAIIVFFTFL